MAIVRWEPARELHSVQSEINRLFSTLFDGGQRSPLARYFQQRGLTAIVLKYRLPDPPLTAGVAPRSQADALAAIRFVRQHAGPWHIDRHRIGILGSSIEHRRIDDQT